MGEEITHDEINTRKKHKRSLLVEFNLENKKLTPPLDQRHWESNLSDSNTTSQHISASSITKSMK